jgi:CheY-like chemotaxis protein
MADQHPILLIEDDDADAILFQRAARKNNITNPVQWVRNGEEAIHYLTREGEYSGLAVQLAPVSIVLDLKMPRVNGFEFLEWLSTHAEFRSVPVLVLSASNFESDKLRAMELGATSFVVKSVNFTEVNSLVQTIGEYWAHCVRPK